MDFKPIRKAASMSPAILGMNKQGAYVTIPGYLLTKAEIAQDARVEILFGEAGRKKCIRVQASPEGPFKLSKRGSTGLLQAVELSPKVATEEKYDLTVDGSDRGQVTFVLPDKWDIARKDLIAA